MKAEVYARYGPPDIVQITDVEISIPKDNEVLANPRSLRQRVQGSRCPAADVHPEEPLLVEIF
jgi:hypothetical protein